MSIQLLQQQQNTGERQHIPAARSPRPSSGWASAASDAPHRCSNSRPHRRSDWWRCRSSRFSRPACRRRCKSCAFPGENHELRTFLLANLRSAIIYTMAKLWIRLCDPYRFAPQKLELKCAAIIRMQRVGGRVVVGVERRSTNEVSHQRTHPPTHQSPPPPNSECSG